MATAHDPHQPQPKQIGSPTSDMTPDGRNCHRAGDRGAGTEAAGAGRVAVVTQSVTRPPRRCGDQLEAQTGGGAGCSKSRVAGDPGGHRRRGWLGLAPRGSRAQQAVGWAGSPARDLSRFLPYALRLDHPGDVGRAEDGAAHRKCQVTRHPPRGAVRQRQAADRQPSTAQWVTQHRLWLGFQL